MDDPSLGACAVFAASWRQLLAIAVAFGALSFGSLCEAALMRVEVGRARQLAAEGRRGARALVHLVERRQEVLGSTNVLLINLAIITSSAYATEITIRLSGGSARWVPVTSVGMIAVLLALCEVTPKTYAVRRPEAVGLGVAPVLAVVHVLLRPLARVLHALGLGIIRRVVVPVLGGEVTSALPSYSDEEVIALVREGEAEGDIQEEEREMIHGVIEFADKVTREVMTPRTDMVCLPAEASLIEAAGLSERTGYSRLPVFEGDLDHIVGILYVKDVLAALQRGADGGADHLTARQIARTPAPVVPESKKLDELLRMMQRNHLHMAIVIDEYGGTAGLVTIEDLLEEIFGEIRDEHDLEREPVRIVEEGAFIVDAGISADDLGERLGVELPEGDFDSLGGFILDRLGRLPEVGDSLSWRGLEFRVEEMRGNRIRSVRITVHPREEAEEADGEDEQDALEA